MKKWFLVLSGAAMMFVLGITGAHAETVLRLTLQLPATHHLGKNVQLFADELAQATNSDIKVEIYPSAQLYKDKEVPQAVASGAVEMGVVPLTQFAGTIPAVELFYVPFLFANESSLQRAVQPGSPVRQPIDDAVLATGARILWWQAYGGAVIITNNFEVHRPTDLKGKKVRIFSKTLGSLVEAAGGAPTAISGSEQFLAYQRGTVDVGLTGVTAVKERKMYEVMNTLTATKSMVDIEFVVLINEKTWQSLSDEQRTIMAEAAAKVEAQLRDQMNQLEADATAFVSDKMTIVELNNDELQEWQKLAEPVINEYIKNAGPLGRQLVEAARQL